MKWFREPLCSSLMNLAEVMIYTTKCYKLSITYQGITNISENYAYNLSW